MATMTVTITNVPTFGGRGIGYQFTGTVSLPMEIPGPIRINSMSLYYGYGRVYVFAPFLTAVCGDTTFRTDYFSTINDDTLRERTLPVLTWTEGTSHILSQSGRTITFTVQRESSTSANLIDRPRSGDMTLTVDYTVLESGLTLNKTDFYAGETLTAAVTPGLSTFSHQLVLSFGNRSHTITLAAGVTTASYTFPLEWLDQIPQATYGYGAATLTTLDGGTAVGQTVQYFSLNCPASAAPTCQVTASLVNGFSGLYLAGRSSVDLTIVNAAGKYGAWITGYRLSGAGFSQALQTARFGPLPQGTLTFTAQVTDSRGRVGTATVSVNVLAYAAPTLVNISLYRSDASGTASDTGGYILARATAGYTSLNGANAVSLQARYRIPGGAWSAFTAMTSGQNLLLGGGGLSPTVSYEAQILCTDAVGLTAEYTRVIPTASVAFHLKEGGLGAAFGMYQEQDRRFSVPADWGIRQGTRRITPRVRNLLDNSDFTNVINQRGKSSYVGYVYGPDRWVVANGTKELPNQLTSAGMYLCSNGSVLQRIADNGRFTGKTFALAAQDSSGKVYVGSGIYNGSAGSIYVNVDGMVLSLYHESDYSVWIAQNINTSGITLVWAALYEGEFTAETLPEYLPKGYAVELAECQRYYQVIPAGTQLPCTTVTAIGAGVNYRISPMWAVPSVSFRENGASISIYTTEWSVTTTNYTVQYGSATKDMMGIYITLDSGSLTMYKPGVMYTLTDIILEVGL